jgi:thiol-disulfide isomerase/thioredoxin
MRKALLLLFVLIAVNTRAQTDASGYPVLPEGSIAPPIRGVDPTGRAVSLKCSKADWTVLFFYEPGCHFCEYILPDLQAFYRREHGPHLEFIAVALTEDSAGWKQFVSEHPSGWIDLLPAAMRQVKSAYRIEVAPTLYLVDRKHRIRSTRLVRSDDLELRWFELFNEL